MIKLSKSCIDSKEKEAVLRVLNDEYLGMGDSVKKFEEKLSLYLSNNVSCVSSGTAALQLALEACGIKRNDEILVQSLTYVASFQAISATGAIPVACDIDDKSLTICLKDAKKKLSNKTKAIMPVHYSGGVGNLSSIYKFAKKNNLRVIEDAAHAFGTEYNSKKVGSFGDIICFSFDGIKNITSGEGGCVVSSNQEVINYVNDSRLLGIEKDSEKRYLSERSWSFNVKNQGWRYHMSNLNAAIGLEQLKKVNKFFKIRKSLAKRYDANFLKSKYISSISRNYDEVVPHIYPLRIMKKFNREELRSYLLKKNIQTGLHYQPNHFLDKFFKKKLTLPVTERIFNQIITLPLHPDLNLKDIDYISKTLKDALKEI